MNLWMDWITETPDENQRRRHDNLVCVVDTVIKGQTLPNGHCDDAFDHWVPINARNCSLFTELQISERLKLLCNDQTNTSKHQQLSFTLLTHHDELFSKTDTKAKLQCESKKSPPGDLTFFIFFTNG